MSANTLNLRLLKLTGTDVISCAWINDNLDLIEMFLAGRVLSYTATPPGSPSAGDVYLVAASATGAWVGQDNKLAVYKNAAWTFYTAFPGLTVYAVAQSKLYQCAVAGTWAEVVAASGDVVGPGSATDNAIVRFDGTTGKLIQSISTATIDDSGNLSANSVNVATNQNYKYNGTAMFPTSATDNAVPRFDSTTGRVLQASGVTISDVDALQVPAGTDYTTGKCRNVFLSTGDPSGGGNGDIWIKYTA